MWRSFLFFHCSLLKLKEIGRESFSVRTKLLQVNHKFITDFFQFAIVLNVRKCYNIDAENLCSSRERSIHMKCPICGKDVELLKKQIGTDENGEPILNEYAICRDCKKQWNLDKQRAKKMAAKQAAAKKNEEAVAEKAAAEETVSSSEKISAEKPEVSVKEETAPVQKKKVPAKRKEEPAVAEASKEEKSFDEINADPSDEVEAPKPKKKKRRPAEGSSDSAKQVSEEETEDKEAARARHAEKRRRQAKEESDEPVKKPVKKRRPKEEPEEEEQRYANIPSEKVRSKHEKAVRESYEEMLATDPNRKPVKKKKKAAEETEDVSVKETPKKKKSETRPIQREPEPEYDDEDDYYDDDEPRFRPMRVILGILSLAGFGFFIYKAFIAGLSSSSAADSAPGGTNFIILALCMLVSALLYFIMINRTTIFAFLLPMVCYIGCAVFAFINRGDDFLLFVAAIISVVLALISLILAITSRSGGDYEYEDDDYDDDDFDDDDYDE